MFSLNIVSQDLPNLFCFPLLYDVNMSIGTRIRQLRKANKLSGDKFGELCGVTKGTVSQWESGLTTPMLDRLVELQKHLDFSFDWLLNGKDDAASAYRTSDPTLVEILKVLEPRADYDKAAAYKAVVTTMELVDHAKQAIVAEPAAPSGVVTRTISVSERRLKQAKIAFQDRRKGVKNAS